MKQMLLGLSELERRPPVQIDQDVRRRLIRLIALAIRKVSASGKRGSVISHSGRSDASHDAQTGRVRGRCARSRRTGRAGQPRCSRRVIGQRAR